MSSSARFQNCELLFDITRFFSIGYIGEVCSNIELILNVLVGFCVEVFRESILQGQEIFCGSP